MVDRIGQGGSLAREAILAALKAQAEETARIQGEAARIERGLEGSPSSPGPEVRPGTGFGEHLREGLAGVEREIRAAERLPEDLLSGKVDDFHEVAIQLKQADLTFKFAMEIRNKLIDAYREVMRMNV